MVLEAENVLRLQIYVRMCVCSQEGGVLTAVAATPVCPLWPPCGSRPGHKSHFLGEKMGLGAGGSEEEGVSLD